MDQNTQSPTNKLDTFIKGSGSIANDIISKTNPTSKVTHKVLIDDPDSKGEVDLFDRDINLEYSAGNSAILTNDSEEKLTNHADKIIPDIDFENVIRTGNTKDFTTETPSKSLDANIIPEFSSINIPEPKVNTTSELKFEGSKINDEIDESAYDISDESNKLEPKGLLERLKNGYENVVDNDLLDTFNPDSKRRIIIIVGIIILIFLLCLCAFISQSLTGSTFFNMLQSRTSTTQVATIDEDVNNSFSGIWGDLSNQINSENSASSAVSSNVSATSSKEQILIKKIIKPYSERYLSDLAFDGTEKFVGSFILYKQFLLNLSNYNYNYNTKTGSEFMSKYGWKEGIIATLSGSYNGSKYTINQVLSRMPEANAKSAISDDDSNFNYLGCRVFELENNVEVTEGIVKLFKVVCYNSSKYSNDPNGFLVAKFAKKDIFGIIDIIGKSDIVLLKNITSESLAKLD